MKTAIITGVTSGIGKSATFELINLGYTNLYLLARNQAKLDELKREINLEFPQIQINLKTVDLSDFTQVQKTAKELAKETKESGIDLLLNNAGVGQNNRTENVQGFEYNLATNYLSQVVLTEHLLDNLNSDSFTIFTSSMAYRGASVDFDNMNLETGYNMFRAYGNSKAYQMMYAKLLRKRFGDDKRNLHFEAIHPGVVRTNWARQESNGLVKIFLSLGGIFMISSEYSAKHNVLAPIYEHNFDKLNKADIWMKGEPKMVGAEFMKTEQVEKLWKYSTKSLETFLK